MNPNEKLRVDYEQTVSYHHHLADIRFRLLTLMPLSTGAAIMFVEKTMTPAVTLAIGLLGFTVTIGVTFYDQRNTQIYDAMQKRAKALEALLGFPPLDKGKMNCGGPFLDRPHRNRRFFGLLMWHDRALAIIYAATFAGWSYLIADGSMKLLFSDVRWYYTAIRLMLPAFVFFTFFRALMRFDDPTDIPEALPLATRNLAYRSSSEEHALQRP
jgi:hypothetical protein